MGPLILLCYVGKSLYFHKHSGVVGERFEPVVWVRSRLWQPC